MLRPIPLILAAFLASLSLQAHAAGDPLQLVSEEEVARDRQLGNIAQPPFQPKAYQPGAPAIEVSAPKPDGTLKAPFAIKVLFKPQAGAEIMPDSFQALYGAFRFDITQRITAKAKVTREGIEVGEARIPPGSHRLTLLITDSQGRVGEKQLSFTVE